MLKAFEKDLESKESPIGQDVFCQLLENARIPKDESMPLCQDTALVVVFAELG